MAVIVEDGSGRTDSQVYISTAEADAYHTQRGNTAWAAATTPAKEIALVRSTEYIDRVYESRWKGRRLRADQALHWPRTGVYDSDSFAVASNSVPVNLRRACAEAALRYLSMDLQPDNATPGIVSESVTIPGPISTSTTYAGSKTAAPYVPVLESLLSSLAVGLDRAERS